MMAKAGEMGYSSVLTAPKWGFYDVLFSGEKFKFQRPYGSYIMENILFKLSFPAEFHAQTAVECAVKLHSQIKDRLNNIDEIEKINLITHESAILIISKIGALHNPADRDHCLQYMTAVALLFGNLTADHYEDAIAKDPRLDALREKMEVTENKQFSKDYLDPDKRSIANTLQIHFKDGSSSDKITIEYPIGHRRRREEGIPVLLDKFKQNVLSRFPKMRMQQIFSGAVFRFNLSLFIGSLREFI